MLNFFNKNDKKIDKILNNYKKVHYQFFITIHVFRFCFQSVHIHSFAFYPLRQSIQQCK